MMDVVERALLAVAIIGVGLAIWRIWQWQAARTLTHRAPVDPLLAGAPDNAAVIVYFTTPNCIPCRTQQQPALEALQQALNERVHIVRVDASVQPDAADRWGVLGAPTTFVLNPARTVTHINRGVTSFERLREQIGL